MIKLTSLLNEIEFPTQKAFDTYTKAHKLRPDTKVKVAGKLTTAGAASKVKGTSVFGGKSEPNGGGMDTVNSIAGKTGLRTTAIASWGDTNDVDLAKIEKDIKSKKLKPMDLMTAISGNAGNKYAKDIIAKYSRSQASTPSKMGVDSVVYNKKTNTVGIVRMSDERGETKTDADGNVNTSDLEPYNPTKYPHQKDAQVAPSTQKEVDKRGLWNPYK